MPLNFRYILSLTVIVTGFISQTQAQCSTTISPIQGIKPSVASGYAAAVVATGLTAPRSLEFDSAGNLLVLEAGKGVSSHVLNDGDGTCLSIRSSKNLISDKKLNHGLALSRDSRTLYVSDADKVYAYNYDAQAGIVSDNRTTLIFGMQGTDHMTRTLLIPSSVDNYIVVNRGSTQNLDELALDEATGVSHVKAFDLTQVPSGGYRFSTSGQILGWGLRNEVGIGEASDGGIWGVENSADQLRRNRVDIYATNPAEELNWLGYLNETKITQQGSNFGYPTCFTVWDASALPNSGSLQTGDQFALDSNTDCSNFTSPRLAFHPHTAPLDLKFNDSGSSAWMSFHGSWNSPNPVGYYVGYVDFVNGQPDAPRNSNTSLNVVLANEDNSKCPKECFRPAGLRFDSKGRLLITSDTSGELYVIQRTIPTANSTNAGGIISTPTSNGTSASTSSGIAVSWGSNINVVELGLFCLLAVVFGMI